MNDEIWELAKTIHEAKNELCWKLSPNSPHIQKWPDCTRHNYGHNPQPWVDIAIAQAKAVLTKIAEKS